MQKVLILLTFLSTVVSHAIVDMKNANFADTWVDIIVPGSGYDLRVTRFYNSRSLINGIFGFGWCSDFETKINVMPEGSIKLTECGAGQEIIFQPKSFSGKELGQIADQIIGIEKKKLTGQKASYWSLRRQKILDDHDLRGFLARKYRISGKITSGKIYMAGGSQVDSIILKKGQFTRRLEDGTYQKFNSDGQIIQLSDRNGNFLKINYKKGFIADVVDNNGRSLTFRHHKNGKVKEIKGPNGLRSKYEFKGLDDLKTVTNSWGNRYTYDYDELHNLTKITYPDKTTREISYDKKRDWVIGFKDRAGCKETYKYQLSKQNPRLHYWSDVEKKCGKEVVSSARYEFWYKRGKTQRIYLHRAQTVLNDSTRDIVYHETFGKPVSIKENGIVSQFHYYPNGLLKVQRSPAAVLSYRYNKLNKVSHLETKFLNAQGKVIQKNGTQYKYSKRGNLKYAESTNGKKIALTYDNRGRISTIKDQAKRVIQIKYEERFGKPAFVTRPGLGTIRVTYDSKGDIKNVESKEGPMVAMQVASAFNNLLDIIGPAASGLNLN